MLKTNANKNHTIMKKIFTLILALASFGMAQAQIDVTYTKNGSPVKVQEGETIEFFAEEMDFGGGFIMVEAAPKEPTLTNVSGATGKLSVTVTRPFNQSFTWCGITSTCAPMPALTETREADLIAGEAKNLELHTDYETGAYGSKTAKVEVFFNGKKVLTYNHKITYADPSTTGIDNVLAGNGNVDVYTLGGVLLRSNMKAATATQGLAPGVYIVGGKKVLVK